ncbi:MAG TPA: FAD:protein FMN transferase [Desulfurivibrionaceae bacterium]|nr:FAD:protein FMN transferase [Desulfurivibrionaceae bacterium]
MSRNEHGTCNEQRRSFLKLSGLLGLGAAGAALLPATKAEAVLFGKNEYKVSRTKLAMGSFVAITAIHSSRDQAEQAIGRAFEEIDRLAKLLSRHDSSTPVSQLNQAGSLQGAPLEVLEVVSRSLALHRETNGAFDITVKPILDLYQERFAKGIAPTEAEIKAVLPRVGTEHLRYEGGNIRLTRQGMGITLDGIAPGYIVDRASEVLTRHGVINHLINCSGDIRVSGTAAKGKPWTVAIQDPAKGKAYPQVVRLTSGAISTSGDYELYYDREKMFHHIVDHRTGHSPVFSTSVTVAAPTVMEADALATALCVMEPVQGVALINRRPSCASFQIGRDGVTRHSSGWNASLA